MRKLGLPVTVLFLLSLFFTAKSFAQGMGGGGRGAGSQQSRQYNPSTVETISGEVVSVDKIPSRRGMSYGVHLTVKTDKETIPVHLGPGWYLDKQPVQIKPQDQVTVTGSRITYQGKPAFIAAEIQRGGETLKLRDQNGVPLWSGGKRGGGMEPGSGRP